nr:MAG TPA: hypothetical protein [Caudoviricetes sp.]
MVKIAIILSGNNFTGNFQEGISLLGWLEFPP